MIKKQSIKILSVVGARPNFVKIAPIEKAIRQHNSSIVDLTIEHLIVHTGQHYDALMSGVFFDELDIPKPLINLEVGGSSHAEQTAKIMERFEPVLMEEKPDILLVVGDVNSTLACSLVASKINYNGSVPASRPIIAHVEAGLRSYDRTMPEEINRILTDALSDIHFITEESALRNLIREGISKAKIHFVGNVMIDSLITFRGKALLFDRQRSTRMRGDTDNEEYGVITLHRPSNVDSRKKLCELVDCIKIIASRLPLIFPIHPRTQSNLEKFKLYSSLRNSSKVYIKPPLSYFDFIHLVASSRLVITDSGGIQEETTFLQIPCITLRNNTERPVTVDLGTNYLVGTNTKQIIETAFSILKGFAKSCTIPPLWDGRAGQRIVEVLLKYIQIQRGGHAGQLNY